MWLVMNLVWVASDGGCVSVLCLVVSWLWWLWALGWWLWCIDLDFPVYFDLCGVDII